MLASALINSFNPFFLHFQKRHRSRIFAACNHQSISHWFCDKFHSRLARHGSKTADSSQLAKQAVGKMREMVKNTKMDQENLAFTSSTVSLNMPQEPRGSYRGSNEFIRKQNGLTHGFRVSNLKYTSGENMLFQPELVLVLTLQLYPYMILMDAKMDVTLKSRNHIELSSNLPSLVLNTIRFFRITQSG